MRETSVQTDKKNTEMVSCGVQAELVNDELEDVGEVFPGAKCNGTVKGPNGELVLGGKRHLPLGCRQHASPSQHQLQSLTAEIVAKTEEKRNIMKESMPYVSIVGVVVIGVSIMAILNNWQKGER